MQIEDLSDMEPSDVIDKQIEEHASSANVKSG